MCFVRCVYEVLDPHQEAVWLWIPALPLEKLFFLPVHLLTCLVFLFACLISAECNPCQSEVVS